MNKTTTNADAQGTIQAIVIMKNGDRVERTIGYNQGSRDGWQNAMRQVGGGLVPTYAEADIASLVTITAGRHGTDVSHYTGPTEAAEILGFLD